MKILFKLCFLCGLFLLICGNGFAEAFNVSIENAEPWSCFVEKGDENPEFNIFLDDLRLEMDDTEYYYMAGQGRGIAPFLFESTGLDVASYSEGSSTETLYTLLYKSPDKSVYRYKMEGTIGGQAIEPVIMSVSCFKVEVGVEGEVAEINFDESSPLSGMRDFFKLTQSRVAVSGDLLVSDLEKYVIGRPLSTIKFIAASGTDWRSSALLADSGNFSIYGGVLVNESMFEKGEKFDFYYAINNTLNQFAQMYERPWFGNIRHYNEGITLNESNYGDNYFALENFVVSGNEHPERPVVTSAIYENGVLTFRWNAVEGATSYIVRHLRDDLGVVQYDFLVDSFAVENTFFSKAVLNNVNALDCFEVYALDTSGVRGPYSQQVCVGTHFHDVPANEWFSHYTNRAVADNILTGYTDKSGVYTGFFGPGNFITKGEALKLAAKVTGRHIVKNYFSFDLPYSIPSKFNNHWAYEYIWSASILEYDLVEDIDNFNPDAVITRGELIHLLAQSLDVIVPTYSGYSFADMYSTTFGPPSLGVDTVYPYANDIEYFKDLGIVRGYANTNNFGPNSSLLRAEAAKIFMETKDVFILSAPKTTL